VGGFARRTCPRRTDFVSLRIVRKSLVVAAEGRDGERSLRREEGPRWASNVEPAAKIVEAPAFLEARPLGGCGSWPAFRIPVSELPNNAPMSQVGCGSESCRGAGAGKIEKVGVVVGWSWDCCFSGRVARMIITFFRRGCQAAKGHPSKRERLFPFAGRPLRRKRSWKKKSATLGRNDGRGLCRFGFLLMRGSPGGQPRRCRCR